MNASPGATLLLTREQPFDVARLDRDRQLHRIRAGAYVRKKVWDRLAPWERYRLRVLAVARTWQSPVFCLESAAVLHGLPIFGEPTHIHLLSGDGRSWSEGDVIVHGHVDPRGVTDAAGMKATSLGDTAVDLARVLSPAFALAVVDAAARILDRRGESIDVSERGRAQRNRRGVRQLDWVQARASPVSESVGESVSRAVIEWLGYEAPLLQQVFNYEGETGQEATGDGAGAGAPAAVADAAHACAESAVVRSAIQSRPAETGRDVLDIGGTPLSRCGGVPGTDGSGGTDASGRGIRPPHAGSRG